MPGGLLLSVPSGSWVDQFVLRGAGPGGALAPFRQAVLAGDQLSHVAEERSGLPRAEYDALGTARHQARLLSELARMLDEDVANWARKADDAPSPAVDPVGRARVLASALSGVVRSHATLLDTCSSMLVLAEQMLVVRRQRSRLELMAAVETLRAAASTAHLSVMANLPRLTDSVLYDELASGLGSFDVTLALANRISHRIRSEMSLEPQMPPQRSVSSVWSS